VTPDSFFDGGRFFEKNKAIDRAHEMAAEGARIIDIGGESTRPGAGEVPEAEELDRVMPVIEALAGNIKAVISVDTRKSAVAEAALKSGASIVNDVSAFTHDARMAGVAARHGAAAILMHMQGTPVDMQVSPHYDDVIKEISAFLDCAVSAAVKAGVGRDDIIIDPGIGFGKTFAHNLRILDQLGDFRKLGHALCVGTSRKSLVGRITGSDDAEVRLAGTVATLVVAVTNGADILRVHDVAKALEAARAVEAAKRWRN
jgi:dihydropteroate synthase